MVTKFAISNWMFRMLSNGILQQLLLANIQRLWRKTEKSIFFISKKCMSSSKHFSPQKNDERRSLVFSFSWDPCKLSKLENRFKKAKRETTFMKITEHCQKVVAEKLKITFFSRFANLKVPFVSAHRTERYLSSAPGMSSLTF